MKALLMFLLSLVSSGITWSQSYFYNLVYPERKWIVEFDPGLGLMNCLTDLGGRKGQGRGLIKDLYLPASKADWVLSGALVYKKLLAIRVKYTSGSIAGDDHLLLNTDADKYGRYGRNLSFQSIVREWQAVMEWYPFYNHWEEDELPDWRIYFVSGVGRFRFNPVATWKGKKYALWPLRLEGQGLPGSLNEPYSLQQWSIPIAFGWRYRISPVIALKWELCYRKLFTDYLDDVSSSYVDPLIFTRYLSPANAMIATQLHDRMSEVIAGRSAARGDMRGNPKRKDCYLTMDLKLSIGLRKRE